MKLLVVVFTLLSLFLLGSKEVYGLSGNKLFVFGNSYVDTGNTPTILTDSWKDPYGTTYPGKPSGRWSDGRVWSDYIAQHLKLKSPIPYAQRGKNKKNWSGGMNFAYGGTGVFDTAAPFPNMTTQIDLFKSMIGQKAYKAADLKLSVALVSVSGDDLQRYIELHGSAVPVEEWHAFQDTVVNQTIANVKRLSSMGVTAIAVDSMQPLGCLPTFSDMFRYTACYEFATNLSIYHNTQLLSKLKTLAKQRSKSSFFYLDLFSAWNTTLAMPKYVPWAPCCAGTTRKATCSSVNDTGGPLYTVCTPVTKFYWDTAHPTQQGWKELYSNLKTTFNPLR